MRRARELRPHGLGIKNKSVSIIRYYKVISQLQKHNKVVKSFVRFIKRIPSVIHFTINYYHKDEFQIS